LHRAYFFQGVVRLRALHSLPTRRSSDLCVVESGTFANAQFFAEYRPYIEKVRLKGINPGMEWQLGDKLKLNAQLNYTKSEFSRENRKSTRLNSSHVKISYAVFCLKKKN